MANNQDGAVIIGIDLDMSEFDEVGKKSEKLADNLSKNFSKAGTSVANGIKTAFDVTLKAIAATSAAVTAVSAIGINYNMQMENYLADFTVMLGSTEAAVDHVEKLKDMAAKTPFEMTDLAQADKILLAFGSTAETVQGQLQMLGDISLGNSEKLNTIATAFGRIQSNGRASMEELNMMIDAGFNPLNIIARETGETMEEVRARVTAGKVSYEEIAEAMRLATSEGGQFYRGMEVASKTASGQISTLKDNVNALLGDLTEGLFDGLRTELIPRVNDAVEEIHTAFNEGGAQAAFDTAAEVLKGFIGEIAAKAPGAIATMLKTILPIIKQTGRTIILSLVEAVLGENVANQLAGVFDAFDEAFGELVKVLASKADDIAEMFGAIIEVVLGVAEFALPLLIDAVTWLLDNLDELEPVLFAVVAGFAAFKTVDGVEKTIIKIQDAFWKLYETLALNPVIGLIAGVAAAFGAIAAIDRAVSNRILEDAASFAALSDAEQEAIDRTQEYIDKWEDVKSSSSDRAEQVEAEYGYYQQLSDELKTIVDENGKIKTGYEERAKVITTTLSEALGVEIQIIDGQIQGYQELQTEIDKTIEKKMAEAQLQAYGEQYNTALKNRNQLEKDHLAALDALNKKQKEREKLQNDLNEVLRQSVELGYVEDGLLEEIGGSTENANARLAALDKTIEETTVAVKDSERAYLENQATLQLYGDALSALESGEMADFNDAILMLGDSMLTAETASEQSLLAQLQTQEEILAQMEQGMKEGSLAITQAEIDEQKRRVELAKGEYDKLANAASEGALKSAHKYAEGFEEGQGPIGEALGDANALVKQKMDIDLETQGRSTLNTFIKGLKSREGFLSSYLQTVLSGVKTTAGSNGGGYSWNESSGPGSEGVSVLSYTPVDIPKLAQGAVIPPNKPFFAQLGDQRNGTNIEAPLETIKQAVIEAFGEDGSRNRQIVIPVYISGRQVYEAIVEENDRNTIATGRNAFA